MTAHQLTRWARHLTDVARCYETRHHPCPAVMAIWWAFAADCRALAAKIRTQ